MLDYHDGNNRYSSGSLGHVYTTLFILRRYSASEYVVGKKTKKNNVNFVAVWVYLRYQIFLKYSHYTACLKV